MDGWPSTSVVVGVVGGQRVRELGLRSSSGSPPVIRVLDDGMPGWSPGLVDEQCPASRLGVCAQPRQIVERRLPAGERRSHDDAAGFEEVVCSVAANDDGGSAGNDHDVRSRGHWPLGHVSALVCARLAAIGLSSMSPSMIFPVVRFCVSWRRLVLAARVPDPVFVGRVVETLSQKAVRVPSLGRAGR